MAEGGHRFGVSLSLPRRPSAYRGTPCVAPASTRLIHPQLKSGRPQVRLLLRVLPLVAQEKVFALKGGTAISPFERNLPRLSVDIDLTYAPFDERAVALDNI